MIHEYPTLTCLSRTSMCARVMGPRDTRVEVSFNRGASAVVRSRLGDRQPLGDRQRLGPILGRLPRQSEPRLLARPHFLTLVLATDAVKLTGRAEGKGGKRGQCPRGVRARRGARPPRAPVGARAVTSVCAVHVAVTGFERAVLEIYKKSSLRTGTRYRYTHHKVMTKASRKSELEGLRGPRWPLTAQPLVQRSTHEPARLLQHPAQPRTLGDCEDDQSAITTWELPSLTRCGAASSCQRSCAASRAQPTRPCRWGPMRRTLARCGRAPR